MIEQQFECIPELKESRTFVSRKLQRKDWFEELKDMECNVNAQWKLQNEQLSKFESFFRFYGKKFKQK